MKIKENILAILAECRIDGNTVFLPPEQLDRATYTAVNKALVNIGGKWNRGAKGHVFDHDPTEDFDNLLITGETEDMKKAFQFFPTPMPLAEKVAKMAELDFTPYADHCNVLEPSAGAGNMANAVYHLLGDRAGQLICCELNENMKLYLDGKPYTTMYCDFLSLSPETIKPFSRIVMNPPFTRLQDVDHVLHAYDLLADDGILVSIMSVSSFFRQDKKSKAFMAFLDSVGAEVTDVPAGAFAESGTKIATKIVKIRKEG